MISTKHTRHHFFDVMKGCIDKLDRYSSCKFCELIPVNETVGTPVISTRVSVACLQLQIHNYIQSKLSAERYKYHVKIVMKYCYTDEGSCR
jgi:hypothetical protein